jgi:hypothetical protein
MRVNLCLATPNVHQQELRAIPNRARSPNVRCLFLRARMIDGTHYGGTSAQQFVSEGPIPYEQLD